MASSGGKYHTSKSGNRTFVRAGESRQKAIARRRASLR